LKTTVGFVVRDTRHFNIKPTNSYLERRIKMALWKPFRGNRADLDAVAKHDGYVYFCVDDATLFFDYIDTDGTLQRKQINAKDAETFTGLSLDEIKKSINYNDLIDKPALEGLATETYVDEAIESYSLSRDLQIYIQATTPTDANIGAIWVDPSVTSPMMAEEVEF
jgi:hypothetical protein